MKSTKSTKVPKGWEEFYSSLTGLTDRVCEQLLDREYAELARYAIAALCRKRPCPLVSGEPRTWACAILYALGQVNFLTDRSSRPYMSMADLAGQFGVASSTAGNKAKVVRKALGMHQLEHTWMLPSRHAGASFAWLIDVDGWMVDARTLPINLQEAAVRKGLIPYVHGTTADKSP